MRRLSILVLPFLAAFALVFGLFFVYRGYLLAQAGQNVSAALVFLFGVTGVGLAVAIWMARKHMGGRSGGASNARTGPPSD
jgi:predicted Zn-dependent protease